MKDELFLRGEKVPMTKEAVRALALSKLELHRASHLIDIGAGTGSVSIEAALQYPGLRVTAIERNPAALSGGHLTDLIDWSMRQLHPAGRLVMTFILQENLNTALVHLDHLGVQGVDCLQLQVSSLTTLGSGHYFKPNNPVFVIACQKEGNHV